MLEANLKKPQDKTLDQGSYVLFTLAVMGIGWIIAAVNTGISYLALGMDVIPIVTGLIGCLAFAILLRFLHCAWWLAFCSFLPAVLVLVGSVQYAPEATLDDRGVRESGRVAADSAAAGDSNHRFTLIGPAGRLKETLDYDGDDPSWHVGDRVEVIRDPKGVIPLEVSSDVDPANRLGSLAMGVGGWTGITLLAGRRGFVRRRASRRPAFED
ncbi:hypothetical protein [Streptomyces sp. NBC_00083]|uniref:hypothetical protein n=1 Tax=Streptomyces sp. NBC_00083 TaxID=2975647 RepID=UPI00225640A9|nr:hypothetical protein [Streptomyces sp. NBC_00083]MCX5384585.1 hypothetical protein [Streptomyces sp. NBC_00083]